MGPARAPRHIAFVAFAAMVMILGGPLGMFPTIEGKPAVELRGSAKTTNIELSDRLRAPRRKNKKGVPPRRRMHPTPAMLLHKGTPLRLQACALSNCLLQKTESKIAPKEYKRGEDAAEISSSGYTIPFLRSTSRQSDITGAYDLSVTRGQLFNYGVIPSKLIKIDDLKNFPATAFARRQLWVIALKRGLGAGYQVTRDFIRNGDVFVGVDCVRNPFFFVNREVEQMVRWNPVSKIREKIRRFHHTHDDYEVMNGQYVVPEAELENLRPLLDDDIFDPYTAFRRTEAELIQDKRKMLKDPYSTGRLPHFQTLEEVHEYQKNTMVEKTKLPGGAVAFRFVEPFASRIMHDEKVGDMLRSYDMKKGRLEAPPGTAIYARRKRLAEKNHRETKEHSAPGAVL
eukprot:jgi/Bigna1/136924/aug1.36_g11632